MVFAIETSCDETAVAVVRDGRVLASVVASQAELHAAYGGVVPELAVREHLLRLPPAIREALRQAGAAPRDLAAVAVTRGPGLPAALMAGVCAARGFATALGVPLLPVHHHEAHLYSPWMEGDPFEARFEKIEPHIALVVSGGHTLLAYVPAMGSHEIVGETLDDAAGECLDKIAKMIGLPYPGGPWIDTLAENGDPAAMAFPRPRLAEPDEDFSFSGLKTSVRHWLDGHPKDIEGDQTLRDFCASALAAVVEPLAVKTIRAAERRRVACVTASGGVARNRALRQELATRAARRGFTTRFAPPELCGDNAVMVGLLAESQWRRHGAPLEQDWEPDSSWELRATAIGRVAQNS